MNTAAKKDEGSEANGCVGLIVLGVFAAICYALYIYVKYAGWPALAVMGGLVGGTALRFVKLAPVKSAGAMTLAFAAGLVPHTAFLLCYNLQSADLAADGASDAPEPTLFWLANAYESFVVAVYRATSFLFSGWHLALYAAAVLAATILLCLWRVEAAQQVTRVRRAVTLAQVGLAGAVALTVLSNAPVGRWTPDYGQKLEARLVKLDRVKATELLLENVGTAIVQDRMAIHTTYAPALNQAAKALDSSPQNLDRLAATMQPAADGAAGAAAPPDPDALTGELKSEAAAFADRLGGGSGAAGIPEVGDAAPELGVQDAPAIPTPRGVDRQAVIRADDEIAAATAKAAAMREACSAAVADVFGDVVGNGFVNADLIVKTFSNAFTSSAFEDLSNRVGQHWTKKDGTLVDWLTGGGHAAPISAADADRFIKTALIAQHQAYLSGAVRSQLGEARSTAVRDAATDAASPLTAADRIARLDPADQARAKAALEAEEARAAETAAADGERVAAKGGAEAAEELLAHLRW